MQGELGTMAMVLQIQGAQGWVPRLLLDPELNALLVLTIMTLPVVLLFAALSYHAIEKPFLMLRKSYTRHTGAASPSPVAVSG